MDCGNHKEEMGFYAIGSSMFPKWRCMVCHSKNVQKLYPEDDINQLLRGIEKEHRRTMHRIRSEIGVYPFQCFCTGGHPQEGLFPTKCNAAVFLCKECKSFGCDNRECENYMFHFAECNECHTMINKPLKNYEVIAPMINIMSYRNEKRLENIKQPDVNTRSTKELLLQGAIRAIVNMILRG